MIILRYVSVLAMVTVININVKSVLYLFFRYCLKMEAKRKRADGANLARIGRCLETCLYPSLVRVLGEAHGAGAINHSHKFRRIFLNKLAEDLWLNNPLHPERVGTPVCDMPFATVGGADGPRPPSPFSWGMSRDQAAIAIQVSISCQNIASLEQRWILSREIISISFTGIN